MRGGGCCSSRLVAFFVAAAAVAAVARCGACVVPPGCLVDGGGTLVSCAGFGGSELVLSGCGIGAVNATAFLNCSALLTLRLDANELRALPGGVFRALGGLQVCMCVCLCVCVCVCVCV